MRANFFQPDCLTTPSDELRWHQRAYIYIHLAIGFTLVSAIVAAPFVGLYHFLVLGERTGLLTAAFFLLVWWSFWQVNQW